MDYGLNICISRFVYDQPPIIFNPCPTTDPCLAKQMYFNLILLSILTSPLGAQQAVNLNDRKALTDATNLATRNLASYYQVTDYCMGCIPASEASDATGMQWYENGSLVI